MLEDVGKVILACLFIYCIISRNYHWCCFNGADMKRVKFCGGALDGSYCLVAEQLTKDENGILLLTLPDMVCCDTGGYKDIIYHKQERKGEIKYVWIDECKDMNK